MSMEMFSPEYKYVKGRLKNATFSGDCKELLDDLKLLMTDQGFSITGGKKLDKLRTSLGDDEAKTMLTAVGINPGTNSAPDSGKLMDAACIKFLRHTYLIAERGAQKVWVHSLPGKYRNWATDEIWGSHTNIAEIKEKLNQQNERFSKVQRTRLGEATMNGMRHAAKGSLNAVLAYLNPAGKEMDIVKRWFADGSVSEAQLKRDCLKLSGGLSKCWSTLNSNHVVFTDMPSIRKATAGSDDAGFEAAYAFVYSGRYEKIPIIYIENAFFAKNTTPIGQKTLWALTVLHETTHLDLSTKDHRYDFKGLQVGPKLSHDNAMNNADSWAYYAADCAGELTANQSKKALRGW